MTQTIYISQKLRIEQKQQIYINRNVIFIESDQAYYDILHPGSPISRMHRIFSDAVMVSVILTTPGILQRSSDNDIHRHSEIHVNSQREGWWCIHRYLKATINCGY